MKLPGDVRIAQAVKNVSVINNFYVVEGADPPDFFETMLSELEGNAAAVLSKVLDDGVWPLPPEDRAMLAYFAAVQYVRGPNHRRGMEQIAAIATQAEITFGGRENVAAWIERNHGFVPSDEQAQRVWEDAIQEGGPPIKMTSLAHVRQILDFAEHAFPYFVGRIWVLVEFERRRLYTSDAPISLIANPREIDEFGGVGLATAWGITFPISRRAAIMMLDPVPHVEAGLKFETAADGRMDWREKGSTSYEHILNDATLSWSREWLYHHPDDAAVLPDDLPEPRTHEFDTSGGNFAKAAQAARDAEDDK